MRARISRIFGWVYGCSSAIVAGVLPSATFAMEYQVSVGYSAEYTNNARLTAFDGASDLIHRPTMAVTASHAGAATELDLGYRLSRRIYQDDAFDGDTVAEGTAYGAWHTMPGRLTLFASSQTRESEISNRRQSVPDNLQVTSRNAAGATLRADLLANHFSTLSYEYALIDTGEKRIDSRRHIAQLNYVIPLSGAASVQFIGSGTDAEFDAPLAPGYRSVLGAVQYDRVSDLTVARLDLGYTMIDRELTRSTVEGVTGGIELIRNFSPQSSIGFSYANRFQDNSLDARERLLDLTSDDVIIGDTSTTEVYQQKVLVLTYNTRFGIHLLTIQGVAARQAYEDVAGDQDRLGAEATLSRNVSSNLTASVDVGYRRYQFDDDDRIDRDYGAGVSLGWTPSPRLSMGARLAYFDRKSSGATGDRVDAWVLRFNLEYVLFGNAIR